MTNFRTKRRLALLCPAILALASCGGGGDIENELSFRIIQASPDAPLVNFLIDGIRVRQFVNYKSGYGSVLITPGTYDLTVEAILPGEDAPLIDPPPMALSAGKDYTFIVIGKDADDAVELLEFESPIEDVPESSVRVQVAHAAPDVGPVDVYMTAPDELLSAATPIAQETYGNLPGARQLVPSGTYVISVTPAGVPGTVLFDTDEIALSGRQDLLLVAVANTTAAREAVPISLLVNSFRATSEIQDKDLPSELRVVHVSPDAPPLDLIDNRNTVDDPNDPDDDADADDDITLVTGLAYLGNSGYITGPSGFSTIRAVETAEPATTLFDFLWSDVPGRQTTVLALNLLASINDLVLVDDIRSVHAEGKLRIVNAAPASGVVDVYILEPATPVESATTGVFNFGLGGATAYLSYEPGNYRVTFTKAGDKTMVLATADVAATAGTVHTAILVDEVRVDESSDGKPPSVLLIDDLAD